MSVTNAGLAFILARHFGGLVFNEYIAITSVAIAISQATKGLQSTTATEFIFASERRRGLFHTGDFSALLVGSGLLVIWLLASPLIILVLDISLATTITAGFLLPAATMGYRAAGKYQGTLQFTKWQIATCLTSMLQIPLMVITLLLKAPLSAFIASLALPSMALFLWATLDTRNLKSEPLAQRNLRTATSSVMAVSCAFGLQIPLLFLQRNYISSETATLTAISLLLVMLVGISTTLGSFLLPRFVAMPKDSTSNGFKTHLYTSIPSVLFVLTIPFIAHWVIPFLFGPSYDTKVPTITLFGICMSYSVWAVVGSAVQERLGSVTTSRALIFAGITIVQLVVVSTISMPIRLYYIIHLLFGIINLALALTIRPTNKD
jgi:hypothetical protein